MKTNSKDASVKAPNLLDWNDKSGICQNAYLQATELLGEGPWDIQGSVDEA